MAGIIRTEYIS